MSMMSFSDDEGETLNVIPVADEPVVAVEAEGAEIGGSL